MAIKPSKYAANVDNYPATVGNHSITVDERAASSSPYSALRWRTSSASVGAGECVEVANSGSFVLARDSRDRVGAVLEFTPAQWLGLIQRIKSGDAVDS